MTTTKTEDPFSVLGLPQDASEAEVRARYLELVKQFPPETAPDKFREIRAAFESAKDPLMIARQLTKPPDRDGEPPSWESVIEAERKILPNLQVGFLLSMGNRKPNNADPGDTGAVPGKAEIEPQTDNS